MKSTTTPVKFKTVDEYIAALPPAKKSMMKELRKTIREAAPGAEELISYNMPAFKLNGFLVSCAAWKEHISIYPRTKLMEVAIKELSSYEGAKGTIKFPIDQPLPLALISRIIKFRVKENQDKTKQK